MIILANLIEDIWRAVCHYYTMPPHKLDISMIDEIDVMDNDLLLFAPGEWEPNIVPLDELDFDFVSLSRSIFP